MCRFRFRSRLTDSFGVSQFQKPVLYSGRGRPPKRALLNANGGMNEVHSTCTCTHTCKCTCTYTTCTCICILLLYVSSCAHLQCVFCLFYKHYYMFNVLQ